jgi:hypothetical protein
MRIERDGKVKTAQRKPPTKANHVLQVRLSKKTVTEIDYMIAAVPQLEGFSRSKFFRAAVLYALDCLSEEGYQRQRGQ